MTSVPFSHYLTASIRKFTKRRSWSGAAMNWNNASALHKKAVFDEFAAPKEFQEIKGGPF